MLIGPLTVKDTAIVGLSNSQSGTWMGEETRAG